MAVKVSPLSISKKIPRCLYLYTFVSSISSANSIQMILENDPQSHKSSEFEAKIQFLKNKVQPDSFIRVLESTEDLNSSVRLFKWASFQRRFRHTAGTYCQIILKLGMAGKIEEMEGFCSEMVREKCPGVEEAFLILMDTFIRNGRLNEALRVLVNSVDRIKPSINVFNSLLGALVAGERDFNDVLFVYKEMVKAGIVPNVDTLNYLLEALFEAERTNTALDQYRRMNKKGCEPNCKTFQILITGLVAKNRVDESIIILNDMFESSCVPDLSFYTCLIPLFCRINKLEVAMKLFKNMNTSKFVPGSLIYEDLIQCLCENLCISDAVNLLKEMTDIGLIPTDSMFVHIVDGFCKLDKFIEAKKFLKDNHVLESYPYNLVLGAYCYGGNFVEATDLFDELINENRADCLSWNIIIGYLCDNAEINKALKFLCRMIVSSFVPDSGIYSALIVGKCKSNEIGDAFMLFHQVSARSWVLDSVSYVNLVECLCQRGKIQEATEVFCYMSSRGCTLPSFSFNKLIKGLCTMERVDKAISLLSLADNSGISCSNDTYNTILLELSMLDKAKNVLAMLSRMIVEGRLIDAEAYCILIKSMISLARIKDCVLFFNLMVSKGFLPDSKTLANLLCCLEKHFQLHMIIPGIDKLVLSSEILDSKMYNVLIDGLWKEKYRNEAHRFLDMMLEKGWVPDVHTHVLLIGSAKREEAKFGTCDYEKFNVQDPVSSILAEGLDTM